VIGKDIYPHLNIKIAPLETLRRKIPPPIIIVKTVIVNAQQNIILKDILRLGNIWKPARRIPPPNHYALVENRLNLGLVSGSIRKSVNTF
jgi:hypothetical protein